MNRELLRRACERAGGVVFTRRGRLRVRFESEGGDAECVPLTAFWLPSYVADILVGMVFSRGTDRVLELADRLPQPKLAATPEQRITAAMEVLSDE